MAHTLDNEFINPNSQIKSPPDKDPMLPCLFSLEQVKKETHDTFTFYLSPYENKISFPFQPGQFNMLYNFGNGEVPISISGNPSDEDRLVHTVRLVGSVTRAMKNLKRGDVLGVRGPFGNSWPVYEAIGNDVIVVAGGIGLAPLRPVLYKLLSQRDKYGKIVLLYGTRTPEDILFKSELEQFRSRFDLEVHVTVDRAQQSWKGNVGVVTRLIPKATFDPLNSIAVVCGPEVMMRFTALELEKHGVPSNRIYISMERNMKCAVGFCGHCQLGPTFICKDGPVFRYDFMHTYLTKREI
ncbi:MAG: FAD/NAD(P)-binding protein [Ignavibacteriaceae bacterium]